ncbi:hypothetical protein LSH36_1058g00006 [Paralvinella palmiformis]|uniref:Uncharacterized protein n=1 Tax=Paralvinella palmiformis TaxID=53620 RepID=A0AAD9IVI6_9ANNE|nr:hypothetical protein LSH36_1058g00006 [Paralvinella palmiformis]
MVTQSSATLIDKIYVKCDKYENVTSRTLITYISDNFPILTCLDIERVINHKKSLTFMQHQLGHSQLRNMSEALKTTDWDHVFGYDKLEVLQKKTVRTMTRSVYKKHVSPLFRMVHILKFRYLNDHQINGIMFDFVHPNLPLTLLSLFEYHAEGFGLLRETQK